MSSGKEIERFQKVSKILKMEGNAEGVIEVRNGNHHVTFDGVDYRIDRKGLWERPAESPLTLQQQFGNTLRQGIPAPVFFPLVYGVMFGSSIFILMSSVMLVAVVLFNYFTKKPSVSEINVPSFRMIVSMDEDERFMASHPEFIEDVLTAYKQEDADLRSEHVDGPQHPANLIRILAKDMRKVITLAEQVGGPSKIDAYSALKSIIKNPPASEKHLQKMKDGLKKMATNLSSIITSRYEQQHNGFADVMDEANNRIEAEAKMEKEVVEGAKPDFTITNTLYTTDKAAEVEASDESN